MLSEARIAAKFREAGAPRKHSPTTPKPQGSTQNPDSGTELLLRMIVGWTSHITRMIVLWTLLLQRILYYKVHAFTETHVSM